MARVGSVEAPPEPAQVVTLAEPDFDLAEDAFELDIAASG